MKFTSKLFGRALSRRIKATVLYATETGKSEQYAKQLVELLGHAFNAQVCHFIFSTFDQPTLFAPIPPLLFFFSFCIDWQIGRVLVGIQLWTLIQLISVNFVSHICSFNVISLLKSIWANTQFCRTNYYSFLAKLNYLNCSRLPILSCAHLCIVLGLNFHTKNNILHNIYRAEPNAFYFSEWILNLVS